MKTMATVIAAEDHQVLDSPHHPSPSERSAVERSKRRQKPKKSCVAPKSRLKLRAKSTFTESDGRKCLNASVYKTLRSLRYDWRAFSTKK